MKTVHLCLAVAWLLLAIMTIITGAVPSVFGVVLMCLIISIDSLEDYIREKDKEVYK